MPHRHREATARALEALRPQGDTISLHPQEEAHVLQRTVWEALGELMVADTAVRIWLSEVISGHIFSAGFVARET